MSATPRLTRQETVKKLFGRELRVALAEWILQQQGREFRQSEASMAMARQGLATHTSTPTELETLVRAGMLHANKSPRHVAYRIARSPLWNAFEAIITALSELGEDEL